MRAGSFSTGALEALNGDQAPAAIPAHQAQAAGLAEAAIGYNLAAGQQALRVSTISETRVHLEQVRPLAQEAGPVNPEVDAQIRAFYWQWGQAFELGGQSAQAQAVHAEWKRLAPKLPQLRFSGVFTCHKSVVPRD